MCLTRRVFVTGFLGLAAGLGIGFGGRALADRPTGARLAEALNRRLAANPTAARFDVPAFEAAASGGQVRLQADVRLAWAPGVRLRRVEARAASEGAAWAALLDAAVVEFAGAVPGFDGTPATA